MMRYVWKHYDTLPETLVFMPSSEKWMRLSLLQSMLAERHVSNAFRCIPMYIWLPHLAKWMIDRYVHRSGQPPACEQCRQSYAREPTSIRSLAQTSR